VVAGNKDHVVSVDSPKRCEAVANDSEEGHEDQINYMDRIKLLSTNVYPA
jgi:hypothetical protein